MARIGSTKGSTFAVLALAALLLSAVPASGQAWKDAYLKGLELMAAQRWEEAVQAFDDALRTNPRENRSTHLYGMRYGYFPHREKGIALYRLGQWDASAQALEESLRQGHSADAVRFLELARKRQPTVELPRVFQGAWWDHYDRGVLAAERGLWQSAIEDFRAAYRGRSQEDRFARTYGVQFIEYFPLRELGVALYYDGQYAAAVQALERSLATASTAKAAYYLNLARAALLRQSRPDRQPPRIRIDEPTDGLLTNAKAVEVRGAADSRNLVAAVEINGEPLIIEPAAPSVPFAQTVPLVSGRNVVEVVARDLVAQESKAAVNVVVDREGPAVEIEAVGRVAGGRLRVEGTVYDNLRLGSLAINGQPVRLSGALESRFAVELSGAVDAVSIEAADAAGNLTRARLPLPPGLRQPGARRPPTVVPVAWPGVGPAFFHTREALGVELEPIPSEVQQDTISISWVVTGASPLASVKLNEETKTVRHTEASKPQIFSHILPLEEGENVFVISVSDRAGRTVAKTVRVVRKLEEINQIGSRLSVAVMPFQHKGRVSDLYLGAYEAMVDALVNQRRFKLVNRAQLESILKELKLSQTELVDPATAVRVGKLVAAEAILIGTVNETTKAAEVYAQMINTETSTILVAQDVFDPDKSPGSVRVKLRELAAKIRRDYPLVDGPVIGVRNRRVALGLGALKRVRQDMKVIVYLEGEPLVDPQTRALLDRNTETLGEGLLNEVRPQVSYAVVRGEGLGRIERGVANRKTLRAITK